MGIHVLGVFCVYVQKSYWNKDRRHFFLTIFFFKAYPSGFIFVKYIRTMKEIVSLMLLNRYFKILLKKYDVL